MTPQETEDYNNLIAIINEQQAMFEKLDEFRKERDEDKKKKRLFAVHSHEGNIRRMINREIDRIELRNQKKTNRAA